MWSILILQHNFHRWFLNPHAHVPIEAQCGIVAVPYIQGDVVAAHGLGVIADILKQSLADVLAASLLIHTDVINIQRLDVLQQYIVLHFGHHAEGITKNAVVVKDEYGFTVIL